MTKMTHDLSNTRFKARVKRKTNPALVETLNLANESAGWSKLAKILSSSTRKYSSLNLSQIDAETKEGDTVVIPGKVLSSGNITKKVRICSLSISQSAKDKLKSTKSEYASIAEEIKSNKKGEGIKILQ